MGEQPLPTASVRSRPVFPALLADIQARNLKGVETYGSDLLTHNGRDSLRDLYEEILDAAVYCKQLMMERSDGDFFGMVRKFHAAAGLPMRDTPGWDVDNHYLRIELHREEFRELEEAVDARDMVATADAIADLIYVLCGTAATFGIPLDRVFAEVHRSNMTKTVDAVWREDGKLLKGPHYSPPDLVGVLATAEAR